MVPFKIIYSTVHGMQMFIHLLILEDSISVIENSS